MSSHRKKSPATEGKRKTIASDKAKTTPREKQEIQVCVIKQWFLLTVTSPVLIVLIYRKIIVIKIK